MNPAKLVGVLLVLVAAVLAACSNPVAQPTGESISSLPPTAIRLANGGQVTVAVPYLPTNYNPSTPAGANQVTQMVMEQVWPQAFVIDPQFQADTTGFIDSAELISLAPETIQYKIDPGARWSDGVPISATDFIYNWHEQLAHASSLPFPGVAAGYQAISSITGSDGGRTVTVTFGSNYADWEGLFTNLVPAHVAEQIGWGGFVATAPGTVLSGGPFTIQSYVAGQQLVLIRNPEWWGTPAHLSKIVFRVVKSDAVTWAGLESGAIAVGEVAPSETTDIRAAVDGLTSATSLSAVEWQMCFNLGDSVLGNPTIRQAVAEATDRAQLVADTIGLADPGIPVLDNRLFLEDAPGSQSSPGPYGTPDVAGADVLLQQAGYHLAASGYYVLDGRPLTLTVTAPLGQPVVLSLESVFQAEMKEAGIQVRFDNVPFGVLMTQLLPASAYQVALAPFVGTTFESWSEPIYTQVASGSSGGTAPAGSDQAAEGGAGRSLAARQASGALLPGGTSNFVNWDVAGLSDSAIDTLYDQAQTQLDALTARGLYNEIDSLLWKDLPTLPLFQVPVTLITQRDLVNVQESPTWAGPMWNAQDWGIALNLPAASPASG